MIVRFALTPRSLHLDGIEERRRPRILKCLVHLWGRTGRLVVPGGKSGREAFMAELEQVPQNLRVDWKKALKRYRFKSIDAELPSYPGSGAEDLVELSDLIELVGHALDEFSNFVDGATVSGIELLPTVHILESECFFRTGKFSERNIVKGEPSHAIWCERAKPLAETSRKIIVVDRYCLDRFLPRSQHDPTAGLMSFLAACSELQPKTIVVFAGYHADLDPGRWSVEIGEDLSCILESTLQAGHRIEVRFVPDRNYVHQHDRFIVFDYQVWEIGTGLQVFSGKRVWRDTTSALKLKAAQHAEAVKKLENGVTHWWSSETRSLRYKNISHS